jgi:hypothetical protein
MAAVVVIAVSGGEKPPQWQNGEAGGRMVRSTVLLFRPLLPLLLPPPLM